MIFRDRKDAGEKLAERLQEFTNKNPILFGLPRGGVPVAYEVAKKLDAPLEIAVVRKLGLPDFPELGFGAIAPDGVLVIDNTLVDRLGLDHEQIEAVRAKEEAELDRRVTEYRGTTDLPNIKGKTAIIIDDGIATGITMKAAIMYLRKFSPKYIIAAAPTCAAESEIVINKVANETICLNSSPLFTAVGEWYENFPQTSDQEVKNLLNKT